MLLQNWWYTTLLSSRNPIQPPLASDITADIVIVGAGMAGLSAALRLSDMGSRVVLIDRNICGGSTTGKSAGFLTPDSELELSQILRRFGQQGAHELWQVPENGIALIRDTVAAHGIECDLLTQDSLFLANDPSGAKDVHEEAEARRRLAYPLTEYGAADLAKVIGAPTYKGAVRYPGCFGIDALRYSQGVKRVLLERGVRIFESTEAHAIDGHRVRTHGGSVTADKIIVCADKLTRAFSPYSENVFHAETFLTISEPLTDKEVAGLFPGDPLQCWDTDLVYSYWRLTGDQRLLLGGGSMLTTYARNAVTSPRVAERVIRKFLGKFPALAKVEFLQYWPGLIDMTRDLFPTVLRDPDAPWVQFVLGCVGLPWAAFCGDFAARHARSTETQQDHVYYRYFRPDRPFFMPLWSEKILSKPIVFSLNNVWAKYYQRDNKPAA
ncbi:MAG: FAD-binding oxidoreductase [Alphaproteobacteria bacterium]|nr:FAD-binding oxidoreductase [Alphaproteobacteria bacterium]